MRPITEERDGKEYVPFKTPEKNLYIVVEKKTRYCGKCGRLQTAEGVRLRKPYNVESKSYDKESGKPIVLLAYSCPRIWMNKFILRKKYKHDSDYWGLSYSCIVDKIE